MRVSYTVRLSIRTLHLTVVSDNNVSEEEDFNRTLGVIVLRRMSFETVNSFRERISTDQF